MVFNRSSQLHVEAGNAAGLLRKYKETNDGCICDVSREASPGHLHQGDVSNVDVREVIMYRCFVRANCCWK